MKYVCLGFHEGRLFGAMSESQRAAFIEECFAYDDELRKNGHYVAGTALQAPETANTLRSDNGEVLITDGPFAETKEQLGGFMLLEAKDLNEAIHLLSQHPCLRLGSCMELRPVNEELTDEIAARNAAMAR